MKKNLFCLTLLMGTHTVAFGMNQENDPQEYNRDSAAFATPTKRPNEASFVASPTAFTTPARRLNETSFVASPTGSVRSVRSNLSYGLGHVINEVAQTNTANDDWLRQWQERQANQSATESASYEDEYSIEDEDQGVELYAKKNAELQEENERTHRELAQQRAELEAQNQKLAAEQEEKQKLLERLSALEKAQKEAEEQRKILAENQQIISGEQFKKMMAEALAEEKRQILAENQQITSGEQLKKMMAEALAEEKRNETLSNLKEQLRERQAKVEEARKKLNPNGQISQDDIVIDIDKIDDIETLKTTLRQVSQELINLENELSSKETPGNPSQAAPVKGKKEKKCTIS